MGGSTFWGLVLLLTSCSTFDEVIRLTEAGSSSNVDMLVGVIYGGNCDAIGLNRDVIAASFGKVTMQREEVRQSARRSRPTQSYCASQRSRPPAIARPTRSS